MKAADVLTLYNPTIRDTVIEELTRGLGITDGYVAARQFNMGIAFVDWNFADCGLVSDVSISDKELEKNPYQIEGLLRQKAAVAAAQLLEVIAERERFYKSTTRTRRYRWFFIYPERFWLWCKTVLVKALGIARSIKNATARTMTGFSGRNRNESPKK